MKAMQLIGLSSLLLTSCNQAKEPEVILDAAVQEITAKFDTVPQISTGELANWPPGWLTPSANRPCCSMCGSPMTAQ